MELILIRHGLPLRVENSDGSPADPPLSERGLAQSLALANWLEGEEIHRIYASPLLRARQTADPLAERSGLEVEVEGRVAEYDQDSQAYIPLEELRALDYEGWREFMKRGYPEGMDLADFRRDVVAGLEEIVVKNAGARVAVFCHGGVINAWAAHVIGLEFKLFFNPNYTSINRFLISKEGIQSVASLNETAHLRDIDA
jgi:probable phosphoglycerate mutase